MMPPPPGGMPQQPGVTGEDRVKEVADPGSKILLFAIDRSLRSASRRIWRCTI